MPENTLPPSEAEKIIYNCHNHTFNHENIPNKYFPIGLVPAARIKPLRWVLRMAMKGIIPWTKNDKVHRYANFIKAAYRKTQEANLERLMSYYPSGTHFIVLPMDMAYMGAGKVKEDIEAQHAELARLKADPKYRDILIPFAHIDPRRPGALGRLKNLVENDGFKGVKIYPTLGYGPDNPILMDQIYPYMIEKNIPLMAHCSPGSVNSHDITRKEAHAFADPDNYQGVMDVHPELKVCLGHFGGIGEWRRHLNSSNNTDNQTWLSKIRKMILSGNYPNLYTDISYTIFNFQENVSFLKVLLEDDRLRSRVLFGSDFYMVESEKYPERRLSIDLRSDLGGPWFWEIANTNPKRYIG